MDGVAATAGVTLQPVFIPRQHSSRGMSMQQPGSPSSASNNGMAAAAASADWAYLLRNAAALRGSGSLSSSDAAALLAAVSQDQGGRAPSPQVMTSAGRFLMATSAGMPQQGMGVSQQQQHQHQQATGNSASGLFGSNSMVSLDALGHLSAEALASAACDPSNSLAMLSNGTVAPTLSNMSSMYADGGVQTLYGSNEAAAVASAAAAAAAAAATARATTTQSILQQQAAAMGASNGSLANTLRAGFPGLSSSLNLNGLMPYEESLSGSLFGPGGGAVSPMPKPVSASLYIKNLPVDADKLFLYEKFSPYGAILSVKVLNDPQSGQCRGVGFVNFAEHTSATRSIQALHGTKVGDKLLHVSLQTPRLRAAAMNAMM